MKFRAFLRHVSFFQTFNFVLGTNAVRNVCYILIRYVSYLENANGSINLQSAVSGNDYTVKFSKAVQSGDV